MTERPDNFLPMSEELASLLAKVKSDPTNDQRRLELADWLEERGDPRGQRIRMECEMATLSRYDPRYYELVARTKELRSAWVAWCKAAPYPFASRELNRGLLGMVNKEPIEVDTHWTELVESEWWPWIGELYIKVDSWEVERLFASPAWSNINTLHLDMFDCQEFPGTTWKTLFDAPHVHNLSSLKCSTVDKGDELLEVLAKSVHLRKLTDLKVSGREVTEAGVKALAESPLLGQLTKLDLSYNSIGDASVEALAKSPHLMNLRTLLISGTNVTAEGLKSLLASKYCQSLSVLFFDVETNGAKTFEVLGQSPRLAQMEELHLGPAQSVNLAALFQSSFAGKLKVLSLHQANVHDEDMKAFAVAEHLDHLEALYLTENTITEEGLQALTNCPSLKKLRCLDLNTNRIGNAGVRILAQWEGLANVTALSLSSNGFGSSAVVALSKSPHVSRLKSLDLSLNIIGPRGALALVESDALVDLNRLEINSNAIGEEGTNILKANPPIVADGYLYIGYQHEGEEPSLELEDYPLTNASLRDQGWTPDGPELEEFRINGDSLEPGGLEVISGMEQLKNLRSIQLSGKFTEANAETLANWPCLANVSNLSIYSATFLGDSLSRLLASPHLTKVTSLHFSYNKLPPNLIDTLLAASLFDNITELRIDQALDNEFVNRFVQSGKGSNLSLLEFQQTNLQADSAKLLADYPPLANLTSLHLNSVNIGDEGTIALANSPQLSKLTTLQLKHNNTIGNTGAEALANSPYLGNLKELELNGNQISDSGAKALAKAAFFQQLAILDLQYNQINQPGFRALNKASAKTGIEVQLKGNPLEDIADSDAAAPRRAVVTGTQLDRLMEAIREKPEDNPLRLVLADWLEENGDPPRAELIRIQLELAEVAVMYPSLVDRHFTGLNVSGESDSLPANVRKLLDREAELLEEWSASWLGDLGELRTFAAMNEFEPVSNFFCDWDNGCLRLICFLQAAEQDLISHLSQLQKRTRLAEFAYITEVRLFPGGSLTGVDEVEWQKVVDHAAMKSVTSLEIDDSEIDFGGWYGYEPEPFLRALSSSTQLENLREIRIKAIGVSGSEGMEIPMESLFAIPCRNLTSLSIQDNGDWDNLHRLLTEMPFPQLKELRYLPFRSGDEEDFIDEEGEYRNEAGEDSTPSLPGRYDEFLTMVANTDHLPHLQTLEVGGLQSLSGIQAIIECTSRPALKRFSFRIANLYDYDENPVTNIPDTSFQEFFRAIAASPGLAKFEDLKLPWQLLDDPEAIDLLITSPHVNNLKILRGMVFETPEQEAQLARLRKGLPNVRVPGEERR